MHPYKKNSLFMVSLVSSILLSACSISPYNTKALKQINWNINPNDTQVGKIVKEKLSSITVTEGEVYDVSINNEEIRKRTISVNQDGQPSAYLQEAIITLRVSSKGKEFINEPIIVARELSQQESSKKIAEKNEEMMNELAQDTLMRLSDIANQEKNILLHKYTVYRELSDQPESTSKK